MNDGAPPHIVAETDAPRIVPLSAASWAEQLGDSLPFVEDIAPESLELVRHVRELVRSVVITEASAGDRARAARLVEDARRILAGATREQTVMLMRHRDGRIDNV